MAHWELVTTLLTNYRIKKKVEEYEYDEESEPSFRKSLFKTFNKTLDEGFFPMIIVDAVNHKVQGIVFFIHSN